MSLHMYAQQNDGKMSLATFGGGEWLWDISYFATDAIIKNGGRKKIFHCPNNQVDTSQDNYLTTEVIVFDIEFFIVAGAVRLILATLFFCPLNGTSVIIGSLDR